ncbi:ATP-binding protein [Mycobacteroides abscessus subsp. abscessus]|uniref:ATP-binding protein n=1 Tax=Mycobacteroides abscessus TaxID=36809 RepID=UPI00266CA707|nr:ATP-binding protein [Mycobacteroides abscessus]MDO3287472.1 ATP-binding protein [Mycobacteroides abscessus subsp. abscessus]
MSAPTKTSPPVGEVAKVYSGIRDLEIQVGGEVGRGQRWPGGPYRPAERAAILVLGGGTLWWFDNSEAQTTWPILVFGFVLMFVTVALMRVLIPHVRPSMAVRLMFLRNMFRPPHVVTSAPDGSSNTVDLPEEDTFDPPDQVDGNIVFTKGGVYAEYLLDGLPVLMRAYNVHDKAAKLTRNLGRYLPSGAIVRGLLVAEDQDAISRAMVGPHSHNKAWVRQCRQWAHTIAKPSKAVTSGYTGPVRARFWLTIPVDAGTEGRTPLGQGKRLLDWISGRDKDSDTSLQHYKAVARQIVRSLPNEFNIRPASPAQILWHYTHRTGLGVIHQPIPVAGTGPRTLTAKDFPRTAFDEGDNAERPWWRPSFKPYVRVYNPHDPNAPASYQTFLTVEHFPDRGVRFPRATYLHGLLNVQTTAVIEWAQHINTRTPDQAKNVNFRFTKNIKDQMLQRGERSAEDDELPKKLAHTREYTASLGANPAERELDHTVIIAVGADSPATLDDAVKGIRQELDTVGIVVHRRRGAQLLLWKAFNTGSEIASPLDEFRNPTTAHAWSLFLPLISGRVGNVRGSALAVDQTTMRPSVILHDPEGSAGRNKLTGLAIVGDPGGGKSHRTKLSVLELILRGGRAVIFEPDTIAEWRKALKPLKKIFASLRQHPDEKIPEVRFIDPTQAEWCFDPLVIFPATIAARIAAAHILPWIGLSANSIQAKRYRRLINPKTRDATITSHRALMDYLREQPGSDEDELLLRLEAAEEDFPGLFDDTLPAYRPDDSPATVYLTGNLGLPDAEDLTNPHLYEQLTGPQRAGMAIYGLLIELEQRYMFSRQHIFDVMVFEECAELCSFPVTARIAHKITRRGRKHATGIWFVTQDFRDLSRMGDKFIKQKWIFRVEDRELAELTLRWAGIDPDMYPELIDTLSQDTSPGNTREEDLIEEDEFGMTRITQASAVDPDRVGEGFLVDEIGRAARVQFFGAPTEELAEAFDSTPLLAAA